MWVNGLNDGWSRRWVKNGGKIKKRMLKRIYEIYQINMWNK